MPDCRRWAFAGLLMAAWLTSPPSANPGTRIFYRAQDWLATSPEVQRLLVHGTLRAWEELAETAEADGRPVEQLPVREREAMRLLECIRVHPGLTVEEVRQTIQRYARQHPEEIFSAFGDLAGRALAHACRLPDLR